MDITGQQWTALNISPCPQKSLLYPEGGHVGHGGRTILYKRENI